MKQVGLRDYYVPKIGHPFSTITQKSEANTRKIDSELDVIENVYFHLNINL